MELYHNQYYHIYNRTNNEEALFRSRENYLYFLKKYRFYLDDYFETIAYCLMPTHFHFLVKVINVDVNYQINGDVQHLRGVGHLEEGGNTVRDVNHQQRKDVQHLRGVGHLNGISGAMKTFQSSYTKAINKMFERHGSLFQAHYKARLIDDDKYLITLLTYIHQNPVRSKLVEKAEEWEFSSYQDYLEIRNGTLPSKDMILMMIKKNELMELTNKRIDNIDKKFWV